MEDRKIIKRKIWTIEEVTYDDGKSHHTRTNDGFNTMELLGILDYAKTDILNQIKGTVPEPDYVERIIIKDENEQ